MNPFEYDEKMVAEGLNDDLVEEACLDQSPTFQQLMARYAGLGYRFDRESFEKELKLRNNDGKYNRLAEMLADFNGLSMIFAVFKGTDKSCFVGRSEFGRKCLLSGVDTMLMRLDAMNVNTSHIKGAQRTDRYLVDRSSLREAFINAVVHNDYFISDPAVYVFSDRIEIISYGGLPQGQTEEGFFEGISVPRNPSLMRIFSDLDYVEKTGFGVPEIIKHYGKKAFKFGKNYLIVTLPFDKNVRASFSLVSKKNTGESKTYKTIIRELKKMVKENPGVSKTEMSQELNLSRRKLESLMKEANIVHVGPKNGGQYEIR